MLTQPQGAFLYMPSLHHYLFSVFFTTHLAYGLRFSIGPKAPVFSPLVLALAAVAVDGSIVFWAYRPAPPRFIFSGNFPLHEMHFTFQLHP